LSEIEQNIVNSRKNRQQGGIHDIERKRRLGLFYAKNSEFVKTFVTKINIYTRKRVSQRVSHRNPFSQEETGFLKETRFLNRFSKKPGFSIPKKPGF
jgi:hypothetical protein